MVALECRHVNCCLDGERSTSCARNASAHLLGFLSGLQEISTLLLLLAAGLVGRVVVAKARTPSSSRRLQLVVDIIAADSCTIARRKRYGRIESNRI